MTHYSVELTSAAAKEIRKLDPSIRRRILYGISALERDPRPPGVRKLAGFGDAWRIRIGDYRVLYEVVDSRVIVTVFRIAHRRDVYDGL
ncbi:type II toxin-antitoxin system RelE/ParE family toxin [Microbacterium sp. NPDC087665]|uniref:type II toxin-antitoxin system RelE family toxin n=1 Tax=Microbacterium sp. NPDC087665 TaxID=3364194 RepID=UPI00381AEAD5